MKEDSKGCISGLSTNTVALHPYEINNDTNKYNKFFSVRIYTHSNSCGNVKT